MHSHLATNIRLIRKVIGETQPVFGQRFNATKAMIISYEIGGTQPSELFISRLAKLAGLKEADLVNKKLREEDLKLSGKTTNAASAGPTLQDIMDRLEEQGKQLAAIQKKLGEVVSRGQNTANRMKK